jgi:hypothetical protein
MDKKVANPSDPTAGYIYAQGHYIVHLAFFLSILFVKKPPNVIKCLMNNDLMV